MAAQLLPLLWLALLWAGPSMASELGAGPELLEQGRRIYQQGLLGDGQPLQASGAGGTRLSGEGAACVQCHKRSGMGSREGSLAIPAIAGPLLFAPPLAWGERRATAPDLQRSASRQQARAAYSDATLARALREGLDASGQALQQLMPRYALNPADLRALSAYLHQLSAAPVTGLQDGVLHLATIISPDADPLRAQLLRDTLSAWARAGTVGGLTMELQVWQLQGPAQSWQQQLQDWQRQRPVYAVLSGAGAAEWTPVRDFCEQAALPCLFPMVDLAPSDAQDFYTLYFSRGVPLEAQLLARHLRDQEPPPPQARVIQVYADAAGLRAAQLLNQDLQGGAADMRAWSDAPNAVLAGVTPADRLVLWLRPPELAQLLQQAPLGPVSQQVFLSAQLADPATLELPSAWRSAVRWVSVRADPARLYGKAVLGLLPWAAQLGLAVDAPALPAEVYASTYFFADALARMRGSWNQAYLMETLEGANFGRPAGAAFFSLSLAPGQREAAKGGHLLGYAQAGAATVQTLGPRLTP